MSARRVFTPTELQRVRDICASDGTVTAVREALRAGSGDLARRAIAEAGAVAHVPQRKFCATDDELCRAHADFLANRYRMDDLEREFGVTHDTLRAHWRRLGLGPKPMSQKAPARSGAGICVTDPETLAMRALWNAQRRRLKAEQQRRDNHRMWG